MEQKELGICPCGGKKVYKKISHKYTEYGPKEIILQEIPGKECIKCGKETITVDTSDASVQFLRRVEAGLVNVTEKDGVIVVKFPKN